MAERLFQQAPTLLAVLDEYLVCHHLSWGWRTRLGLLNSDEEQGLSISGLFPLDETVSLEGKLRESLRDDVSMQDIPVSLTTRIRTVRPIRIPSVLSTPRFRRLNN